MKKTKLFLVSVPLVFCISLFCLGKVDVRPSALAGSWFPNDPAKIRSGLEKLIQRAVKVTIDQKIYGFIMPHAGYQYSGRAAAAGYRLLAKKNIKRIIILGTVHTKYMRGASIMDVKYYRTPLGDVPLDLAVCKALRKNPLISSDTAAHINEHSIEIQLPFLQYVLKDFKIVPILVGNLRNSEFQTLAEAIKPFVDDKTIIIASSDFTHHGPNYRFEIYKKDKRKKIYELDHSAFRYIEKLDQPGFTNFVRVSGATICGSNPIGLLIHMMNGKAVRKIVYYTSGDVTKDWTNSVSYFTIAFIESSAGTKKGSGKSTMKKKTVSKKNKTRGGIMSFQLNNEEQETLLKLARETLESWISEESVPEDIESRYSITDILKKEMGVFVTLKKKGTLRGCIGYVTGRDSLYRSVMSNAINASTRDPRFPAVTKEEFKDINIEVSVMTPLEKVKDVEEIEVGKHGLVIKSGYRSGLLLPQVPVEWKWDRKKFLEQTCGKAGLSKDCWKDSGTEILKFSAQVFGEKKQ